MCDRTAVVVSPFRYACPSQHVSPSRYDVILVSWSSRCPLRGRHRMPVTSI
ncbi:hypothetical protein ABIE67_007802 [Streptomyces sp. V4I8]|uniref:hypothetical protein n=1 Tax=Streptomyces sp. V4I8 TaxID=3156469 RepID=UPI00351699DA